MKNAYEVLYRKEADLARVRQEIESLRMVAPMLAQEDLSFFPPERTESENKKAPDRVGSQALDLEATGSDSQSQRSRRAAFWGFRKKSQ